MKKREECPGCLDDARLHPAIIATCYGAVMVDLCLSCRLAPPDQHGRVYGRTDPEGLMLLEASIEEEDPHSQYRKDWQDSGGYGTASYPQFEDAASA